MRVFQNTLKTSLEPTNMWKRLMNHINSEISYSISINYNCEQVAHLLITKIHTSMWLLLYIWIFWNFIEINFQATFLLQVFLLDRFIVSYVDTMFDHISNFQIRIYNACIDIADILGQSSSMKVDREWYKWLSQPRKKEMVWRHVKFKVITFIFFVISKQHLTFFFLGTGCEE